MCQMCLSYDKNKALRVVPNSNICKVVHGTKCQIEFGRKTETCQIDLGPKIVKLIWFQNVKLTWFLNVKLIWIQNVKLIWIKMSN